MPDNIAALELFPADPGIHSGQITVIPKDACLQVCGVGFNDRTIKVRWDNRLCYVFLQDVSL